MEVKAILEILKSTIGLPLSDSQKIILLKQFIDIVEEKLEK